MGLRVFVDTAAWIALFDVRDALHPEASRVLMELRRRRAQLVTSEFVLVELVNAFSAPAFRPRVIGFVDGLRSLPDVRISAADSALLAEGWSLFRQRPDKGWSWTDCTSFVLMARHDLAQALTSDHHFEQAGFKTLLAH